MASGFWILSAVGSLVGGIILILGLSTSQGAPQEAAVAAIAVAVAVLPYVLARSAAELTALGLSTKAVASGLLVPVAVVLVAWVAYKRPSGLPDNQAALASTQLETGANGAGSARLEPPQPSVDLYSKWTAKESKNKM